MTGATGNIGRHFVDWMLSSGYKNLILAVRNNSISKLDESTLLHCEIRTFHDLNFLSESEYAVLLDGVDVVVDLAWFSGPNLYGSLENLTWLYGKVDFARACVRSQVSKYIGIGTCLEYRVSDEPHTVDSAIDPKCLYAQSKVVIHKLISKIFNESNVAFVWARIFFIEGLVSDGSKLHSYIDNNLKVGKKVTLGSSRRIRDYMHVQKVVEKLEMITTNSHIAGVFNICEGKKESIRDIALRIAGNYKAEHLVSFNEDDSRPEEGEIIIGVPNL